MGNETLLWNEAEIVQRNFPAAAIASEWDQESEIKRQKEKTKEKFSLFPEKNCLIFFLQSPMGWDYGDHQHRTTDTGSFNSIPHRSQSLFQNKPVPKWRLLLWHQCTLVFFFHTLNPSASHSAFQCCKSAPIFLPIATLTAKQISHIISLQLCSSFLLPLPLPAEALMWVLLTHLEQK